MAVIVAFNRLWQFLSVCRPLSFSVPSLMLVLLWSRVIIPTRPSRVSINLFVLGPIGQYQRVRLKVMNVKMLWWMAVSYVRYIRWFSRDNFYGISRRETETDAITTETKQNKQTCLDLFSFSTSLLIADKPHVASNSVNFTFWITIWLMAFPIPRLRPITMSE